MSDKHCAHTVLKFVIIDGVTCWSCDNCGEPFVPNHHVERLTAERDNRLSPEIYRALKVDMRNLRAERDRLRAALEEATKLLNALGHPHLKFTPREALAYPTSHKVVGE